MPNIRQIIVKTITVLITLTVSACGTTAHPVAPILEATPTPTRTPTPKNTKLVMTSTPTSGGLVDMGGYKLPYRCFGQGSPTVIVEAGGGDKPVTSSTWKLVTEEVQFITRICIYNRAQGLRTSQDIAEDLHTMLSKIPLPGPYILVGHSLGGYHIRVYTHMYPEDVAGLILVDTTNPDLPAAIATAYPTYSPDESTGITLNRFPDLTTIPTPGTDGLDFNASAAQVRQAGSLGDIPLIVISQNPDPNQLSLPGFTSDDTERSVAAVLKAQSDLAKLSSNSTFIVANTSNHFISLTDPQTIIDAIAQMVKEIRNK